MSADKDPTLAEMYASEEFKRASGTALENLAELKRVYATTGGKATKSVVLAFELGDEKVHRDLIALGANATDLRAAIKTGRPSLGMLAVKLEELPEVYRNQWRAKIEDSTRRDCIPVVLCFWTKEWGERIVLCHVYNPQSFVNAKGSTEVN